MTEQKPRLVVDCDPGCDDALALLLAFSSQKYSCIDISTVAGNVGIRQVTANAHKIVALARRFDLLKDLCVHVHQGAATSLRGDSPSAASIHGRDGLGDVPLRALLPIQNPIASLSVESTPRAASQLFRPQPPHASLKPAHASLKPDLLCLGPLTNVARAVQELPRDESGTFWERWRRVVVMAGALRVPGNISYAAEFNAYADPDALQLVLHSWNRHLEAKHTKAQVTPLVLVPLDVTTQLVYWWPLDLPKTAAPKTSPSGTPIRHFLHALLRKYFLFHAVNYDPPLGARQRGKLTLNRVPFPPRESNWIDVPADRQVLSAALRANALQARRAGKSSLTNLPPWCFLHDPTACWLLLHWEELLSTPWEQSLRALGPPEHPTPGPPHRSCPNGWTLHLHTQYIRVDTGPGEGRGHLYAAEPRRFLSSDDIDARGDLHRVLVVTGESAPSLRHDPNGTVLTSLDTLMATTHP